MLETGTVFEGRYEILSLLGTGGFGEVYKARQRSTGQDVAIKLLRAPFVQAPELDQRRRARLRRETDLCAQIHHPNIVRLLDSGETKSGECFIVFAYVPGRTLTQVLKEEGPLTLDETVFLMGQVLDALAAAHNGGVVHRDLKPSNIMLTTTGVRRNAMVLDFGVGAYVSGLHGEAAKLTGTGEMVGTPHYSPPEQIHGGEVTPRSDLYSWGLVFLECLTGQPVMGGSTLPEIILKQIDPEPVQLPAMVASHPLAFVLERVLIKDVEERGVTAHGVLRELERCLAAPARPGGPEPGPASAAKTVVCARVTPSREQRAGAAADGERRQVTAVSCALAVSGGGDADLEAFDAALQALRRLCDDVARRHGVRAIHPLPDRVVLYFGSPAAREDDPRRAVRAAGELARAARELAGRAAGPRPELQVGVHTGLVIARAASAATAEGTLDVVGPAAAIAAHLANAAPLSGVLVSAETRALAGDELAFEPHGEVRVRGLARPVEAFLLGPARAEPRALSSLLTESTGPLVGRQQELALLQERWRLSTGGEGQAVLVTGEPGIGKSRLAVELARWASQAGGLCLECRCAEESQQSPWRPIADMLEPLVGLDPDQSPPQRLERLEQFLTRHGFQLAESVPLFGQLLSIKAGGGGDSPDLLPLKVKEQAFEAVLSLFFALAEHQPLLVVVEDLHWADQTTLEALELLVEEAAEAPMLVLLTARPEFSPESPGWRSPKLLRVPLARLKRDHVVEMMAALAGGAALPERIVDEVVQRTDGVCLFVEEMTRMLLAAEVLGTRGGQTPTARERELDSVPATLQGLLTSRLDLTGEARRTAQLAAVVGREFSGRLLEAISPLDRAMLDDHLRALIDADLIRRKRRQGAPHYVFKHALIRDVAYGSMLKAARRQAHRDIAAAIERELPQLADARPDLLAHHHARAGQEVEAVRFAIKAGAAALKRSAHDEALRLTTSALDWLGAIGDERLRAGLELELNGLIIPAAMAMKGFVAPEAAAAATRTLELGGPEGATPQTFAALYALTMRHHVLSERARAREFGERLVAWAERAGDPGLRGAALPVLAQCCWADGDAARVLELCEQALGLYDPERHARYAFQLGVDSLAYALMTMAGPLWIFGHPDQAVERGRQAVEQGRRLKHAHTLGLALFFLGQVHLFRGERDEVLRITEELEEVCHGREHRLSRGDRQPAHLPPLPEVLSERVSEALCKKFGTQMHLQAFGGILRSWALRDAETLARLLDHQRAVGQTLGMSFYRGLLAEMLVERGAPADALAQVDEGLRHAERTGEQLAIMMLPLFKVPCLLALGRVEDAERCLRDVFAASCAARMLMPALQAGLALHQVLAQTGRAGELGPALRELCDAFDPAAPSPPLLALARGLLG